MWADMVEMACSKGCDEQLVVTAMICLTHTITWALLNAALIVIQRSGRFERYKIVAGQHADMALVKRSFIQIGFSQLVIQPIATYFLIVPLFAYRGVVLTSDAPHWTTFIAHIAFFTVVVNETLFYWTHRLLHHPSLYGRFHKQHHQFKITTGVAAEFSHPFEHLISAIGPTLMGPLLFRSPFPVLIVYIAFRTVQTFDAHCGHAFPFSPFTFFESAERHDFHHSHNQGNFGTCIYIWDWALGTDAAYKSFKSKRTVHENHSSKAA